MKRIKNPRLLKRLHGMAVNPYSVRDAQTLLAIEGWRRPSLDFIYRFFNKHRKDGWAAKRIM